MSRILGSRRGGLFKHVQLCDCIRERFEHNRLATVLYFPVVHVPVLHFIVSVGGRRGFAMVAFIYRRRRRCVSVRPSVCATL